MPPLAGLDLLSAGLLAAMLLVALYNLATARRLESGPPPRRTPLVSLLVPARDEEENLRELLPVLSRVDYPKLEVMVLDDHSTDGTAAVVREHAAGDGRVRLLTGAPLPPGWLGKNWACHQLAAAAAGEVLVFCDADVTPAAAAVRQSVGLLEHDAVDVATAIPRQRFGGWIERAVIPLVVQLPVLALLPMRRVARSRSPRLSMANGQWLVFARDAYRRCGGHAAVRAEVLEDVALGRRAKAAGLRLLPALATGSLEVRMYRGAAALRGGFGKNLYALLGRHPLSFLAGLLVFWLAAIHPWSALLLGRREALLPFLMLVALRTTGVVFFGHGWRSLLLHPFGAVLTLLVATESMLCHHHGRLRWKGRPLPAAPAVPADVHGGVTTTPFQEPARQRTTRSGRMEPNDAG
jgi:glycosyltransferase involved in cell wall biosynthesis